MPGRLRECLVEVGDDVVNVLDAAFDEMETEYGNIEQYFSKALGIDEDQQRALRDMYLK